MSVRIRLPVGAPHAEHGEEDWLLAGVIGLALAVEIAAAPGRRGPLIVGLVAGLAIAGPLGVRRRHPLISGAAALGALFFTARAIAPVGGLVTPIAVAILSPYSIAAYAGLRAALWGLAFSMAACVAMYALDTSGTTALIAVTALVGGSWATGRFVRQHGREVGDLHEATLAAEHESARREAVEVARERARVARELHDVVAHSMTVVVLQAEAAQRVWRTDPARARESLAAVSTVSRETLGHLRTALSVLGAGDHPPLPRLADVDDLVEVARESGLGVSVSREGCQRDLPAAVELASYRLVQEALTNAARYAAPTDVQVRLGYGPEALAVEVTDRGRRGAVAASIAGTGHGLRGMRERVEACGGRLRAEPLPGGGFTVFASLPLDRPGTCP